MSVTDGTSGIDIPLGIWNRLGVSMILAVSDTYPMFIEPTITWVPSGFSGYIWLDTKIVLKKKKKKKVCDIDGLIQEATEHPTDIQIPSNLEGYVNSKLALGCTTRSIQT